jgi:hypothetical protein
VYRRYFARAVMRTRSRFSPIIRKECARQSLYDALPYEPRTRAPLVKRHRIGPACRRCVRGVTFPFLLYFRSFAPESPDDDSCHVMAEQATLRRKAIKKLEKLELESLPDQLRRTQRQNVKRSTSRHALRMAVARNIELRAAAVRMGSNAPEASSFQRLHSARVAIKQLRDTLELADQVGSRRPPGTLRVLTKAQATLGETSIVKCYSVGSTMFVHRTRRSIPMKLTSRSGWLFQRASVKRIDSPTRRNVS